MSTKDWPAACVKAKEEAEAKEFKVYRSKDKQSFRVVTRISGYSIKRGLTAEQLPSFVAGLTAKDHKR